MITRYTVVGRITGKESYAYLIEDTDECKDFLKAQFDYVVPQNLIGSYFICNSEVKTLHYLCTKKGFEERFTVTGTTYLSVINIHEPKETISTVTGVRAGKTLAIDPADDRLMKLVAEELRDIYGVTTDRVVQACSESDPIQKITVDDVAKLRKELFKEKLDKAVQNIKLDIPSLYPSTIHSPSINMCNWAYGWPTFCHLDIRDMEDMRKEKTKEKTAMKTSITLNIKKVIFNDPATIVIWADGTKTVVKCREGETYSKWAGLALCYAKRINGEKFHAEFKRWCGVEDDIPEKNTGDGDGASVSEAASFASDAFETFGKNASECVDNIVKALRGESKPLDYRDVIFKDSFKAGLVLKQMKSIIDTLGFVSVADCCHLMDITNTAKDHDIGWTDISKAFILPVESGFIIKFPDPSSRTQPSKVNEFKLVDIPYSDYKTAVCVKEYICGLITYDGYATVRDYYNVSESVTDILVSDDKRVFDREYGWIRGTMISVVRKGEKYFLRFSDEPKKLNHEHPNEAKGLD